MADARLILGLHNFRLDGDTIMHNRERQPVTGAHAEVSQSGFMATRRIYLTITGPGYSWTARLDSLTVGRARKFAGKVNAASAAASPTP